MKPTDILVIDDESIIRKGCLLVLADEGHNVECCHTGQQGLQRIQASAPDIVLLDLKLPDMDGLEILASIKKTHPDIYIIIMTGYATVSTAVEAMKLGAFDYQAKPFSDDELIMTVNRAVETKKLVEENRLLRNELTEMFHFNKIVGEHPRMIEVFDLISRVSPTDTTVCIYGESGTGKELIARAIHAHSKRGGRQFVAVDCSTLASGVLESELFGHVKGAFTDATDDQAGLFKVADEGTLFLDDVANLSLEIQAKLLRVLEAREFKPVGSSRFEKTNVRIVTATNQDLNRMAQKGSFREDLYYRLNVFPIKLPPLRERKEDIPKLAYHFLSLFCRKTGKKIEGFSDDALRAIREYSWPGNVRHLKNVIERLVIMADTPVLDPPVVIEPTPLNGNPKEESIPSTVEELNSFKKELLNETFGQVQKAFLLKALETTHWNITRASERVGMKRANFSALMKKHHISSKVVKD
ncbi:MAG: sigma-54-dependent Fis family transcriptional regulator [Acidobacteria bacterium]|nr:sigma-54-dependent Fis family transcriptional regulator [Acidobacteriota bacterium]